MSTRTHSAVYSPISVKPFLKFKREDDGTYEYGLRGACLHFGNMLSGHYFAVVSQPSSNNQRRWFRCNDNSVQPVPFTYLQSNSGNICVLGYSLVKYTPC